METTIGEVKPGDIIKLGQTKCKVTKAGYNEAVELYYIGILRYPLVTGVEKIMYFPAGHKFEIIK